jgi:single-stranded-DNA-specific exonuclease
LTKLSPFGHSNNKPVFRFNNLKVVKSNSVGNGAHTRGIFQNKMHSIEFIAFNRQSKDFYGKYLDVLAVPQLNVHPSGNTVYQLNIVDYVDSY